MLLVDDILFFPFNSILWIFREISKIAHEDLAGAAQAITEQLRILYMQLETGRITEEQFEAQEKVLLDRLDAIESRLNDKDDAKEPDIEAAQQQPGSS